MSTIVWITASMKTWMKQTSQAKEYFNLCNNWPNINYSFTISCRTSTLLFWSNNLSMRAVNINTIQKLYWLTPSGVLHHDHTLLSNMTFRHDDKLAWQLSRVAAISDWSGFSPETVGVLRSELTKNATRSFRRKGSVTTPCQTQPFPND